MTDVSADFSVQQQCLFFFGEVRYRVVAVSVLCLGVVVRHHHYFLPVTYFQCFHLAISVDV